MYSLFSSASKVARKFVALLLSSSLIILPVITHATELPTGGTVIVGDANIVLENPNKLLINQASQNAILEFDTFSIGKDGHVHFANGSGSTLNRVTGGYVSQIDGRLSATGSLLLINPNGVIVGRDGTIDTGGSFLASTRDITNADYLNGGDNTFMGDSDAAIINLGKVSSLGGDITLIAHKVVNEGTLEAKNGNVGLVAGIEILLRDNDHADGRILVKAGKSGGSVTHKGAIEAASAELRAHSGNVYALAQNRKGSIQITGAKKSDGRVFLTANGGKVQTNQKIRVRRKAASSTAQKTTYQGGEVFINADIVDVAGLIDVSGDIGGKIDIGAKDSVTIDNAKLDASGINQGGRIRVGGEFQGGKGLAVDEVQNTNTLLISETSTFDASATDGDGGTVIAWADGTTYFDGQIDVSGGELRGDGGFVETSGAERLGVGENAYVNALAPNGKVGDWLLDPRNITISSGAAGTLAQAADASDITTDLLIDAATINGAGANVSLVASETIIFDQTVAMTNAGVGLTAQATDSITVNQSVATNNGDITLISNNLAINAAVDAGTGTILYDRATAGNYGGVSAAELQLFKAGGLIIGNSVAADNNLNYVEIKYTGAGLDLSSNISGLVQINALNNANSYIGLGSGNNLTTHSIELNANDGVTVFTQPIMTTTVGDIVLNVDADNTGVVGGFDTLENTRSGDSFFNSAGNIVVTAPRIREINGGQLNFNANGGAGTITFQRSAAGTIGVGTGAIGELSFDNDLLSRMNASIINFGDSANTTEVNVNAPDLSGTTNVSIIASETISFDGAVAMTNLGGELSATAGDAIVVNQSITTNNGNVNLNTDNIEIGADINAGTGDVTLDVASLGRAIDLGADNGSKLSLTDAELDRISADVLHIGSADAGSIDVSSAVGPANTNTLSLITGDAITSGNTPGADITVSNLALQAVNGIGSAAPLETQVSNLEAQTNNGGIFLSNIGDLTIGEVTGALSGVRVVTAGDIELTNQGRVDMNLVGERLVGPADVTVIANGATADILTGSNATIPNATVQSTGGTVTLRAERDLLLGDAAGAGTLGNVFGGGSVVLDAGRDITVDTGTFVQASGAGTITANAGRNISIVDTSGPFSGAEIRTQGGDITLTTGASGVFTANNAASPAVRTTVSGGNGNITINADAMNIQNSILAGTGTVTLQTATNGQLIDLGGTDAVGTLGLTDAELDRITAGMLRIGNSVAGSITVSSAIGPALTDTLSLITGDQIVDSNAIDPDITVSNLALQAVNGIGSAGTLETGVDTIAAINSTSGSIKLNQETGLGDLTIGTVDGVVGISNQAITGLSQTRISAENSNLVVNAAISTALDSLLVAALGNNLLDNNSSISTTAGFGMDLQAASMALEGGTITAGSNGRVRISPVFVGQEVDLGSTTDAGTALELSDAELDTITAGILQIGQAGIGDINVSDTISPNTAKVNTLSLTTGGSITSTNADPIDIAVYNLALRSGTGLDLSTRVGNLAFENANGVVDIDNGSPRGLAISSLDGLTSSSNGGTTRILNLLSDLTFEVDVHSVGKATYNADGRVINVNAGTKVSSDDELEMLAKTINLKGDLAAVIGIIDGTASTVNVFDGAEIQDGIDVAAAAGATVNVGDGSFDGGIKVDKALTLLGDGYSNTTIVNVADSGVGMNVVASDVTIDGFRFSGDGSPVDATGVTVDSTAGALTNVLVGDSADADVLGNQFTGLTTGLSVTDGGTGNGIGIDVGVGNVFDNSNAGMLFDGANIDIAGNTFNNSIFSNIAGNYITLANGAEFLPGSPTVLDATGVSFDGKLASAMTLAELLATEDKIIHFPDDNTLGLINISDLFVVQGESIQTAVNAAGLLGGAQTVNVTAGTFGGSVEVWVDDLTLQGQGTTTIIDTDAVDAFANDGDINNGFGIYAMDTSGVNAGDVSGTGDVSNIAIAGFRFTSAAAGTNTGVELGETGVSTASGTIVQNNSFDDLSRGIIAQAVSGSTTISNATMTTIDQEGIQFNSALAAGDIVLIENSDIVGGTDGVRFSSAITGADVTISGSTIEGAGDGVEFAGAISDGSSIAISGNQRVEGLGTFADEDGLGDGIAFRGAISGASTSILIDDNTLIRGDDRGINFADFTTGGPATINDASVTISRNDEIRGTTLDGILFNSNITNASVMIGGVTAADGNGMIIGRDEGLDIENVLGGAFTIANNTLIEGENGDAIEFEGRINNSAAVSIVDNLEILGDATAIIFEGPVDDSSVMIAGNADIFGVNNDGIAFTQTVTNSDITIGGSTSADGNVIDGEDDGIDIEGLSNSSVTIANNIDIFGVDDGIDIDGPIIGASTISIVDNDFIQGDEDGIIIGDVVGSSVEVARNSLILGGLGGSGVQFKGNIQENSEILIQNNGGVAGAGAGIFFGDIGNVGGTNTNDSNIIISGNFGIGGLLGGIIFASEIENDTNIEISDNEFTLGALFGIDFISNISESDILISNNGVIGALGNGVQLGSILTPGSTVLLDSTFTVTDNDAIVGLNGFGFHSTSVIGNSEVTISGNGNIIGGGEDGIAFTQSIVDSDIVIGGASSAEANTISGADDGIDIERVINSTVTISNNLSISGDDDGVDIDGPIQDGSKIVISDNMLIEGDEDGIVLRDIVGTSTPGETSVMVTGNSSITGDRHGIQFAGNIIGSSTVEVDRNGTAIQNGVLYDGSEPVNSTFTVLGGITGLFGADVAILGDVLDSADVTVSRNMLAAGLDGIGIGNVNSTAPLKIHNNFIGGHSENGIYIFGDLMSSVEVFQNYIVENGSEGILIDALADIGAGNLKVNQSFIPGDGFAFGNGLFAFNNEGTGTADILGNWWGSNQFSDVQTTLSGASLPFLIIATGDDSNRELTLGFTGLGPFAFQGSYLIGQTSNPIIPTPAKDFTNIRCEVSLDEDEPLDEENRIEASCTDEEQNIGELSMLVRQ
ncbi:filamentous hemagglutinin N-terminal domain-containing protein [Lentilitoribacter sp. EG35]|uniref:filamentous hemagglutinin N-terminal domain-containing protein n=1 Tax=Lentilitoribacter sp. EG35 TaxID=3234192 RepID=UPI0034611D18